MSTIRETSLPRLPAREASGHKGSYGRVLIIAGSQGMTGAACLAGKSALRGGAGLVTVAAPRELIPIIAGYEPSYLTLPLPSHDGRLSIDAADEIFGVKTDIIAIGPGLGQSESVRSVVQRIVATASVPMVVDADGLNSLAESIGLLKQRKEETILSPHPGEFSRLTGRPIKEIQTKREESAARFAREYGVVVILKGNGSVVTDGKRIAVNETGNPGMATGGTGDVLTGLLAALLAQGMKAFEASRLAVHVHGLAGDLLARSGSQVSLIASDLLDALPHAWQQLQQPEG